jgi:hypothetical protein
MKRVVPRAITPNLHSVQSNICSVITIFIGIMSSPSLEERVDINIIMDLISNLPDG